MTTLALSALILICSSVPQIGDSFDARNEIANKTISFQELNRRFPTPPYVVRTYKDSGYEWRVVSFDHPVLSLSTQTYYVFSGNRSAGFIKHLQFRSCYSGQIHYKFSVKTGRFDVWVIDVKGVKRSLLIAALKDQP